MIIPQLKGGVGNQLFQISTAAAHARRMNTEIGINYNLPFVAGSLGKHPITYQHTLYQKISNTNSTPSIKHNEPKFSWDALPEESDMIIDGYFQSDKYFKSCREYIKSIFTFDLPKAELKIRSINTPTVIMHIRRGDYLFYDRVYKKYGVDYYLEALKYIKEIYCDNFTLLACTDDWQTVRKEFKDFPTFIEVNGRNELEDLYILSQGNYIIGSNSTFAWWGAYLGAESTNIFPGSWFGPDGPADDNDLLPEQWITL
jgi:hypothetical protein